ncbi:MAG: class I SAM-dependent RNA methyltransferase [Gemmatimonadetes bacterium]|nr:class I SAM-dependent RNA methyltransferase [Gemmatimonadota bacterium]
MSITTTIESVAAGGAGVGRLPDGRTVFVHRTAPGEKVEIRVTQEKRRWARGSLLAVREASPDRRAAPCPFYARCGGCTLEHIEYDAQLRVKSRIAADALRRIGGLELEAPEVTPSPREFRYRNRVSFTLLRLGAGRVVAGFHELERPGHVLDITGACLLPEPLVAHAWNELRANWGTGASRLPAGPRLRITVRAAAERAVVLIEGGTEGQGQPHELLARLTIVASLWHRPTPNGAAALLAGHETTRDSWAGEEIELTGSVFLQVNREAAVLLEDYVLARAGNVDGLRVIDAYCGVGLHARRLARAGAHAVGIERDPEAMREARRSSEGGVEYLEGDVELCLPAVRPADLVVLNPPRSGLEPGVCKILVEQPPPRMIYVSCDPATLARDLGRLNAAFRVDSVRCFDLFPQTAHVETVVGLLCVTS